MINKEMMFPSIFVLVLLVCIALSLGQKKAFKDLKCFSSKSSFYKVLDLQGKVVGYIVGVFNEGLPPSFIRSLNLALYPYIQQSSQLMLESKNMLSSSQDCPNSFTLSPRNLSGKKIDIIESEEKQLGIFNSIVSFGPFSLKIPRLGLPYIESFLLIILNVLLYLPDKIIQFFYISKLIKKRVSDLKVHTDDLKTYIKEQKISDSLPAYSAYYLELESRCKDFTECALSHIQDKSDDKPFLMCVSAAHLIYNKGIIENLQNLGFSVEPELLDCQDFDTYEEELASLYEKSLTSV